MTDAMTALQFDHDGAIERDLLIRKLFTGGQNTEVETASARAVTGALLSRIWSADMRLRNRAALEPAITPPEAPLAAATLLLPPSKRAGAMMKALLQMDQAA